MKFCDQSSPAGVTEAIRKVEEELSSPDSDVVHWLRDNGRYLSPNGSHDRIVAVVSLARNLGGIHFVFGTLLVLALFTTDIVSTLVINLAQGILFTENSIIPHHLVSSLGEVQNSKLFGTTHAMWPIACFVLWVLPSGWAYWLTARGDSQLQRSSPFLATITIILAAIITSCFTWNQQDHALLTVLMIIIVTSGIITCGLLWHSKTHIERCQTTTKIAIGENVSIPRMQQTYLTSCLAFGTIAMLIFEGFSLLDYFGEELYRVWIGLWQRIKAPRMLVLGALSLTLLGVFATVMHSWASHRRRRLQDEGQSEPKSSILFGLLAFVVTSAFLLTWTMVEHWLFWLGKTPLEPGRIHFTVWHTLIWLGLVVLGLTLACTRDFLNLSSHQRFYADRLARAYLGAANPLRTGNPGLKTSDVIAGDDQSFATYTPETCGGPIHLINVTLNETIGGETSREQRDRKGLPLAVGPAGISVGLRSHALWNRSTNISKPDVGTMKYSAIQRKGVSSLFGKTDGPISRAELVELSSWIAVSGAAIGTGLGSYTRVDISALSSFFNIRLGYWWDSGTQSGSNSPLPPTGAQPPATPLPPTGAQPPATPLPHRFCWDDLKRSLIRIFPVPFCLVEEWLAAFHSPFNRRFWHLSDGGHYENTGCYELIRRQVPLIVTCDTGRDSDYSFSDMASLVRMARIDFNADIAFLSATDLDLYLPPGIRRWIGTEQELRSRKRPNDECSVPNTYSSGSALYCGKHAALAWVTYQGDIYPRSLLLWIKPSLSGDESLDLRQYQRKNPDFPQDSTAKQFFTEAQWESYRALGNHIGKQLFQSGWVGFLDALSMYQRDVRRRRALPGHTLVRRPSATTNGSTKVKGGVSVASDTEWSKWPVRESLSIAFDHLGPGDSVEDLSTSPSWQGCRRREHRSPNGHSFVSCDVPPV